MMNGLKRSSKADEHRRAAARVRHWRRRPRPAAATGQHAGHEHRDAAGEHAAPTGTREA